jgi:hypothetical protein
MKLLTILDQSVHTLGSSGLIDYFIDSNNAGKVVICLLIVMNCYALSLMYSKHHLFKKVNAKNARDEKRINDLSNIFEYDDALFTWWRKSLPDHLFEGHGCGQTDKRKRIYPDELCGKCHQKGIG